jgi:hypothetical protein
MERLILAAGLVVVAVIVAVILSRRRPEAPTQPDWIVPSVLDRADFARPDAPWLVAVFTSATCATCHGVVQAAEALDSDRVAVVVAEAGAAADLHRRYAINAVPTLVIADAEGVVLGSYIGPVTTADLWAKVAELRGED